MLEFWMLPFSFFCFLIGVATAHEEGAVKRALDGHHHLAAELLKGVLQGLRVGLTMFRVNAP